MTKPKVKKFIADGREIHMVDGTTCVAVCWNIKPEHKTLIKDGVKYHADVMVRCGNPYIDFIILRDEDDCGVYIDEDSPVEGGLSLKYAMSIAEELKIACDYMKEIMDKKFKGGSNE